MRGPHGDADKSAERYLAPTGDHQPDRPTDRATCRHVELAHAKSWSLADAQRPAPDNGTYPDTGANKRAAGAHAAASSN